MYTCVYIHVRIRSIHTYIHTYTFIYTIWFIIQVIALSAPSLSSINQVGGKGGWCLLMGNEDTGVSQACMHECGKFVCM